jgi:hypothetical protein
MALINANPNAELKPEFETVQAGAYTMRVKSVEDRNPEKNDLKLTLEFVDPPMNLTNLAGQPCKAVGNLFDYVMLAADKQWKLRQLTEAAGLPWANYDPTVELIGKELQVQVKLEAYEGEQRNKVARYIVG